jgi:UDP-N-acetylglucosamine/UDP-N-acetylgalactosamine diphosphorylase
MIKVADAEIQKKIEQIYNHNQGHIFRFWHSLNQMQQNRLISQISQLDIELLSKLIGLASDNASYLKKDFNIEAAEFISLEERKIKDEAATTAGENHIKAGKVAAFLVAGGQGTRLGFSGPKGMYPVTPLKQKSLFQLHAEKLLAIERKYGVQIPWYIMTSQTNHESTADFFKTNGYFGYEAQIVFFLVQDMIPAIDRQGRLILDARDHIFMNPNGHGGSLKALWESGAIGDMKNKNIETIFYFQVDNVLTKICDPIYVGYHVLAKSDMSNKVVRKRYPEEKMGILCKIEGKLGLVEYSDLSKQDMYAKKEDGSLKYWAGNIATHLIAVDFVVRENISGFNLPYHIAEKSIPYIDDEGNLTQAEEKNGIKFETFVFDALLDTKNSVSIEVDRKSEFSPLKNKEGENSPQTVQRDLKNTYGAWLEKAGYGVPRNRDGNVAINIEISPLFALDEEELRGKSFDFDEQATELYLGP